MGNEAGSDASVAPAFAPEMPQIMNQGGALLATPTVVTVTWSSDPNRATYEAFGDAIGASTYWKATSEYGIGAVTSKHVEITDTAKSSMSEDELAKLVSQYVEAAPGNGWPAWDASTMYVLYVPEGTQITSGGANDCESTSGYHDENTDATIPHLEYAAVLQACHGSQDVVEYATSTAAHEIVETATDPHTQTDVAWAGFDSDHLAWEIWQAQQDEVADACEYYDDADSRETAPFSYVVQKLWSNAAAKAGHDPCLRSLDHPYFNTTPLDVEPITVTTSLAKEPATTKGFHIPSGTTKTVKFGFYSDGDLAPWGFSVVEGDGFTSPTESHLTITTTTVSGKNGDTADVSITANGTGSKTGNLVTAISVIDGQPLRYMPVLIGVY